MSNKNAIFLPSVPQKRYRVSFSLPNGRRWSWKTKAISRKKLEESMDFISACLRNAADAADWNEKNYFVSSWEELEKKSEATVTNCKVRRAARAKARKPKDRIMSHS